MCCGELKPWNRVHLYPKVKGYAAQVHADRGTEVRKGQLLVALEAPEVVSALHHAEAQVASAEATLIQAARKTKNKPPYLRAYRTNQPHGRSCFCKQASIVAYSRMQADSALAVAAASNASRVAPSAVLLATQLVEYLTVRAPFVNA